MTGYWLDGNCVDQNFESSSTHENKQKHHEESPIFTKEFIKGTTTLLNNFLNNSFLLNDLTVINNPEDNIYWNLAQFLKTGEKQLHLFIED